MNIAQISKELNLKLFSEGDLSLDIEGVVVGDLLSHILTEARENWAWITIHVHLNIAAVALLKELPLVIVAYNRSPQEDLITRCRSEKITLAASPLRSYELCCRLCKLGVGF